MKYICDNGEFRGLLWPVSINVAAVIFSVVYDQKVKLKERGNIEKYVDVERELKKMATIKVTVKICS